ncbi:cortical protein marker for cell polarity-domain-containing protein [Ephemerocybe angulata]|uniref:Cortical protein marker for cell polarity-domain-containing protein n=1 Tax=Ephemerocybe angulata TaxID=980116 RepID=A0A8H6I907_9AGAR|nr:cortical protein marker for cell polarity-domain-containing protein [Tulosesus angulatus]
MFLSLFLLIPLVAAALPNVDFDRMGNVALVGAFAGLDLFQNDSVAFDSATSTLFSRDASGALTRIASTNAGGRILAGCALADTFYFSGLFTTINGVSATNVAAYNPKNSAVTALSTNGPNGQVDALFCDAKGKKVWAGGAFSSPASAVAVWDQPPFGGLAGAQAKVLSITTNSSDSSLFFAGSFVTSFGSSRVLNGTNNPNVPFSAGATPFSSSLVPIPLAANQIQGAPSSSDSGFGDIKNILCPAGSDGPGNSWFAGDGSEALITIRTFSFMSVSGVRLGNTFQSNHGTTSFSVTTLPDNVVETLQYVDAVTGENRTCSGNCPLGTDSSVLYQDFLFSNSKAITGAQIKLSGHTGASAGLHMLQLLSSGSLRIVGCQHTEISGTVQTVLISDVAVNTPSASGPTYTWIPYVSAAGNYDINLLVPGCTNFQDCAGRTSVKVVVFPGEGLPPNVMTISQRNTDDATVLIYSGPILPSSPNFVTTVTMSLADDPEGNGQGGRYVVVADRVQLGNSSTTAVGGQRGFGFLEWPRASTITADGTSSLPNTSITALDALGFDVLAGIGGTTGLTSTPLSIAAVAHHSSGTIYLDLPPGASNILAYRNGALSALPDGGLDGAVTSLVLDGDRLFIGGSFRDTKAKTANGLLRGLALYDVAKNTWTALGAGVNGDVADLGLMGGRLQATGNFTEIVSTQTGFGTDAAGIASWDIASGSWVSSGGFTAGRLTMVADGSSNNQYVAGNVGASRKYGASGMIMLKNGKDGVPQITPIASALGHSAQRTASTGATTSATPSRRSLHATTSWIARSKAAKLFSRQTPSSTTLAALPPVPASPAPAQDDKELTIVGGNFSFVASGASSLSQAIAIYDPTSGSLRGLSGTQLSGTVRAILRDNNKLYVGGEFTMADTNVNGLAIYDLSTQQWDISGLQPLQAAAGAAPVVRSITKATAGSGNIVVAGSFTQAGSLRCAGVCMLDATSKQWNTLGGGIQGEVASIVYAAEGQNVLFAGGSLALVDNTAGNVPTVHLQYFLVDLEANNGDASNVFAGGHSGSGPFLTHWDGQKWTHLGTCSPQFLADCTSSLVGDTAISHLAMVPLQEDHAAQGAIQKDRMLLVSGSLTIIPYIVASSSTGSSGSGLLLNSTDQFRFTEFLAVGVVILISIAIAAGVVFLIALIGILWTLFSRKDDKLTKYEGEEEEDDSTHHRPSSLLEHINAATRTTILGTTSPYSNDYSDKDEDRAGKSDVHDPFAADASNYVRAETPSEAAGGMLQEETSRPAHARYSFDVLDDRDPAWWYARDVRTGREGVVPAAYLY